MNEQFNGEEKSFGKIMEQARKVPLPKHQILDRNGMWENCPGSDKPPQEVRANTTSKGGLIDVVATCPENCGRVFFLNSTTGEWKTQR